MKRQRRCRRARFRQARSLDLRRRLTRPRAAVAPRRRWRRRWLALAVLLPLLAVFSWLWPKSQLTAPPATALFVDRHGTYLAESEGDTLGYWDVEDGDERVSQALLAIEDKRFAVHGGVDVQALGRALSNNLKGLPRQGASTLAMQVARMQAGRVDRGYPQKMEEMAVAWLMTLRHGRPAILRHYLKLVPQGNRIHGVAYAARRYFRKPLRDLSWAESCLLAALPKAPGRMNLYRPSGMRQAQQRARLILHLLQEANHISASEYRLALDELATLPMPQRELRPFNAYHAILRLAELPTAKSYSGPVVTALDLELQDQLDRFCYAAMSTYRRAGSGNIAAVLLSHREGDILAYIGSDFYGDPKYAGSIDFASTPRSAGSTLKPFIYALGLESGQYTAASIVDDLPLYLTHATGNYTAFNYDHAYLGPMLYSHALANSRNIPALTVMRQVGQRRVYERLRELGLGDAHRNAQHYGLSLAIGGIDIRLADLVQAYGCLANDGYAYRSRWLLDQPGGPGKNRIFPERVARQVTQFLADPAARMPSFPELSFPFPVAVKTGTSQGFRDAWAVVCSDQFILGIWTGHPDAQPMTQLGGVEVAKLAREILMALQPDQVRGIDEQHFPKPSGYVPVQICALGGDRASDDCSEPAEVWLDPKDVPVSLGKVHVTCAVDRRNGGAANAWTPAEDVVQGHFIQMDPRYAAWAERRGLEQPPRPDDPRRAAELQISSPSTGGRYRIDPDLPARYQTLELAATVWPSVPEVDWYVDGKRIARVGYPYTARWPMQPGVHAVQVRFPRADVVSEPVTITVN